MAKKKIPKIIYERLSTHPDYLALDPLPSIHWDQATRGTPNPCITINHIGGHTNEQGIRIDDYQLSAWTDTKDEALNLGNVIVEIFNRWKSSEVEYCHLDHNREVYDKESQSYGEHLTFRFKVFDPEY